MYEDLERFAPELEKGLSSESWRPPMRFEEDTLPSFPIKVLPEPLQSYVRALAESTQTPEEMAGMLSLGILATAFQSRFILEVTPDWHEPLCLYLAAVAEPGERKSAVMNALTRPVYQFEREQNKANAAAIARSRSEKRILESKVQKAETLAAKAGEDEFLDRQREALALSERLASFKEVHELRLVVDDTTQEKLISLMGEQGGALTICTSEGGIFDTMTGRYDSKLSIDAYLKAHSGDTIIVDRIGRPCDRVEDPRLTMMVAIQPNVLERLVGNATLRERGLCGRFLYSICQSKVGWRNIAPVPIPEAVGSAYNALVMHILAGERHGVIKMSQEARNALKDYQDAIEKRLGGEWRWMRDWGGKAVGAMLRIAALFHCAEYDDPTSELLRPDSVCAAVQIAEYFGQHASAAYHRMGANETERDAHYLLKRILSSGEKRLSKREIYRSAKGHFRRVEDMDPALKLLTEMGYIRSIKEETGGRPTEVIQINPYA